MDLPTNKYIQVYIDQKGRRHRMGKANGPDSVRKHYWILMEKIVFDNLNRYMIF